MGLSGNLARGILWLERRLLVGLLFAVFAAVFMRGDFANWRWPAIAIAATTALLLMQRLVLVYRVRSRYARPEPADPLASWEYFQLELLLLLAVYQLIELTGADQSPVYPLLFALLAAVGGIDDRRRNVLVVTLAAILLESLPLALVVLGDGPGFAALPRETLVRWAIHLAFIAFFPYLARTLIAVLSRHLKLVARRDQREQEERFREERAQIEKDARQYRLDAGVAGIGARSPQKRKRSSVDSLNQRVHSLLVILREALRPNTIGFYLLSRDGKTIELTDCLSETEDRLVRGPIPAGQGVIGAILKNGDTVSFNHVREDSERFNHYSEKVGLKTFMGVPVIDPKAPEGERIRGVLLVDRRADIGFGADEEQMLKRAGGEFLDSIHTERALGTTENLSGLLDASTELTRAVNLAEVVDEVLQQVGHLFPQASLITIALREKGRTYLAGIHASAAMGKFKEQHLHHEVEAGSLCNQAIDSCTVLPANQFYKRSKDQKQVFGSLIRLDGIQSLKCFPLKVAGTESRKSGPGEEQAIGALVVASRHRGLFPEDADEMKSVLGLLEILSNMGAISIQNAQRWEQLERLATTDGLTGLHNHRRFKEMLDEAVSASLRYSRPLSMILTDIDHFKSVNDTYGHPMGDEVLKRVARVLAELARAADKVCRYGGEEFTVILPETDRDGARMLAERFREEIKAQRFTCEGKEFGITLSLGICTMPEYARHRQELIDRADQSLYHAKHNGRDRTVHFAEIADVAASGV